MCGANLKAGEGPEYGRSDGVGVFPIVFQDSFRAWALINFGKSACGRFGNSPHYVVSVQTKWLLSRWLLADLDADG